MPPKGGLPYDLMQNLLISIRRRFTSRLGWLLLVLFALCLLLGFRLNFVKEFTSEQYRKIRLGMSQREVEAVIGLPAGNYAPFCGGIIDTQWEEYIVPMDSSNDTAAGWWGNTTGIVVWYDQGGHVHGKQFRYVARWTPLQYRIRDFYYEVCHLLGL
jgi:hypothetical protein